jgi:serine protease AprX
LDQIQAIAQLDSVAAIQQVHAIEVNNNVAREIIGASVVQKNGAFLGEGEIVTVCDSGFDKGGNTDVHSAFTGRVIKVEKAGPSSFGNDRSSGHGTHVAGSVLGDGASTPMGGPIQGTAPRAKLIVQALEGKNAFGDIVLFPDPNVTLTELLQRAKAAGSSIHTNSWGFRWTSAGQLPYSDASRAIDEFVWKNPEFILLFSGGNNGARALIPGGPGHVGSHAASKNAITVGSSDNPHPVNPPSLGGTTAKYNATSVTRGNPSKISPFSSTGPTREGRIKPDVVAPGAVVYSARSRDTPTAVTGYGVSPDPDSWVFMSGTSMSTPLVAGSVAVAREYLTKLSKTKTPPSAALIKAVLVNGADATSDGIAKQGFGRVNLASSGITSGPAPPFDVRFIEGEVADVDGEDVYKHVIKVGDFMAEKSHNMATIKITLAYNDWPGAQLQNCVNLAVTESTTGRTYFGNQGAAQGPEESMRDKVNNVEQVVLSGIDKSSIIGIKVSVWDSMMVTNKQPFALVYKVSSRTRAAL